MSVHAGSILTVGGSNVIDRLQSVGLGDVNTPMETIREVGNDLVVDKIPGEAEYTFTMESLDVSTEVMALLTGKIGAQDASLPPGNGDPDGTRYRWNDVRAINVCSPWKDPSSGLAGQITAGHLVPGYFPTRATYRFGVTDNATHTVELAGGSYYYAKAAPVEEYANGDGTTTSFTSSEPAVPHRRGGALGTLFRHVFGVLVDRRLGIEGVDYTVSGGAAPGVAATPITVTFAIPPASGQRVRFAYFTTASKSYPQSTHADAITKPGAVRGKHIQIYLGSDTTRQRLASVQAVGLEATVESEVEREMGSDEIVGRTINGYDVNGDLTVRSRDASAFIGLLSKVTGVSPDEVFGFTNYHPIQLEIAILNPRNPAQVIKTLHVEDAIFQVPGTPARVNTPTDFAFRWSSQTGNFSEYKGRRP